jgi:hypothetical protein
MAKSDRYVVGRVENDIGSSKVEVLIHTCGERSSSSVPVRVTPGAPRLASFSSSNQIETETETESKIGNETESRNWNDGQV